MHLAKRAAPIRLLVILTASLLSAATAQAHEMGITRIDVFLKRDSSYDIRIVVDPETLLPRLETKAGRPLSGTLSPEAETASVRSFGAEYVKNLTVDFDGARSTPTFKYTPIAVSDPASGKLGVVELNGTIPARSKTFRFSYDLVYTTYSLVVHDEGRQQTIQHLVQAGQLSPAIALTELTKPRTKAEVAWQYLKLGFTHILPKGLDHILFVLGICLLNARLRSIVAQVTAFTVAHSITLGLTIYGFVSLSPSIVEPLIALSIVYVAVENVITSELKPWRVAVVFLFGLLHGMGFAGVLSELGLPRSEFFTALVTFNVGVELGQLTVIAMAALLFAQWYRQRKWYRPYVVIPVSMLIALTGLYWTVQRIAPSVTKA